MKKPIAIVIATLGLALIGLSGMASCKQGEGERCQINADCENGICNKATSLCESDNEAPPIDASPDTPPLPIDAPDAM